MNKKYTPEEILKKAISKAVKNGYIWQVPFSRLYYDGEGYRYKNTKSFYSSDYQIVFSHQFAKAFWGIEKFVQIAIEEDDEDEYPVEYADEIWKYHIQQMVLEENPISYLEQFI